MWALSDDSGLTWSAPTEIADPGGPQEGFLGTSRHGVLQWPDGRWLICPRDRAYSTPPHPHPPCWLPHATNAVRCVHSAR